MNVESINQNNQMTNKIKCKIIKHKNIKYIYLMSKK